MSVCQATTGKLYPNRSQREVMARVGGAVRGLWNHFVALNRDRYETEAKFAFYGEMSAALPQLLKEDRRFKGCPHRCAQMTVQALDRALKDSFKAKTGRKGFPRFRRHDANADAFRFVGRELRTAPGKVRLPKVGWVRVRGLAVPDGARLIQACVRQVPGGWGLSITFEAAPKTYPAPFKPSVGIDAGLSSLLTLSDGGKIDAPRLARRQAKRLRRLEREKARRRKGGTNRRRTVRRLRREHARLARRRLDFTHKLTRRLIDEHEGVAVESLSLKGLMRTRMAKSFADAGLGELLRQLRYKAAWAGRTFAVLPAFARSTGVCPDTGHVGPRLPLAVRAWRCECCDAVHDRDVAAARVILRGAVPAEGGEPAGACRPKRGLAVRGGGAALVVPSHGGSPANVACE